MTSLAVRIATSNDLFASANDPITGKPDDIWLDIGPKAWRISDESYKGDFGRGANKPITVDPSNVEGDDCSALTPGPVPLYTGDIVKVRLEKKGIFAPKICGIAEGPDSLATLPLLSFPPKPSDVLTQMQTSIQVQREALDLKHQAIQHIAKDIGDLQDAINNAQAIIDKGADLATKAAQALNDVDELQRKIDDAVAKKINQVCHDEKKAVLVCAIFAPACVTIVTVCVTAPAFQQLTDAMLTLKEKLNTANADVAGFSAKLAAATAAKATNLALEAQKQALLKTDQLEYDVASKVADGLDSEIGNLKSLIDKATPDIDIPLPGQWKPDSVTLIVNGRDYVTFQNNGFGRLRQGHSEWENHVRSMSDAEYFVQGLRVNINKAMNEGCVKLGDETKCGWDTGLTTPFAKMNGFSGWDMLDNLGTATITGILRNPPSPGADAYVSFDLQVLTVDVLDRHFDLGQGSSIRGVRHIRCEYLHEDDARYDPSHENWKIGDTLKITGPIRRDRDRTSFFEIHPKGVSNISRISQ